MICLHNNTSMGTRKQMKWARADVCYVALAVRQIRQNRQSRWRVYRWARPNIRQSKGCTDRCDVPRMS